jgi:hypothetical protein
VFTDGNGYRWDIEYDGGVEDGTNYIYDDAMLLQFPNAGQFYCQSAWIDEDGDEVELGPFNAGALKVYRRVRVYQDRPLARWLDIFVNETDQDITQQVMIRMETNNNIQSRSTTNGNQTWEDEDWYLFTTTTNSNQPKLLHIVCGAEDAPQRPSVDYSGSYVNYIRYNLTIPAHQAVVLCHFESQSTSPADHQAVIDNFNISELLSDLPGSVRRLVVNFQVRGMWSDINLARSDKADVVVLANGDEIFGTVQNPQFDLTAFFGNVTVPAEKLVGMAMRGGAGGLATVALADGQILCGRVEPDHLNVTLSTGGELQIPLQRVDQWSFKISDTRPTEVEFTGPVALLRTGDRVSFDPAGTQLQLFTAYGNVPVRGQDLLEVRFDNSDHAIHQVLFANGSIVAGILEPRQLQIKLALGPEVSIQRDMIHLLVFAEDGVKNPLLTTIDMANGDVLLGKLTTEQFDLAGDYGDQTLAPANLSDITFADNHPGRAALHLWDGTLLRGQIRQQTFGFKIVPGPELQLPVSQIQSVRRTAPMAPQEIADQVEDLVVQLGAESYQDREQAQAALIEMGSTILPLLRERRDHDDPEVRERLQQVIQQLEGVR